VVVCVADVGCCTVVSRVVVVVVVDLGSSLAQELRKTAIRSENKGMRSFFMV
jgi:hypothetical protein